MFNFQDEVLAHRLGLIPIRADPKLFFWKAKKEPASDQGTLKVLNRYSEDLKTGTIRNPTFY
jgi:DNA-directed RNA polymerase alpha subunit